MTLDSGRDSQDLQKDNGIMELMELQELMNGMIFIYDLKLTLLRNLVKF